MANDVHMKRDQNLPESRITQTSKFATERLLTTAQSKYKKPRAFMCRSTRAHKCACVHVHTQSQRHFYTQILRTGVHAQACAHRNTRLVHAQACAHRDTCLVHAQACTHRDTRFSVVKQRRAARHTKRGTFIFRMSPTNVRTHAQAHVHSE